MRAVELIADLSGVSAEEAFPLLYDFKRYPSYSDQVLELRVERETENSSISNWKVKFGPGTAAWSQRDTIDRAAKTIRFQRLAGDIDEFTGAWTVQDVADGSCATFSSEIDTGLFLLASIVEPMIAKLLRENISSILSGLFGAAVSVREQPE